jgi:hypothetical protein
MTNGATCPISKLEKNTLRNRYVLMGTCGKTVMKKFIMGSAVEKVIGNAGCAVLVVKA